MFSTAFPVKKTLGVCLMLVLGVDVAHAQTQPQIPQSGQLLQQVPPAPRSPMSNDPGLQVQHADTGTHVDSAPFHVERIEITGATLLPTAQLHALVASGEGRQLTLDQLDRLADRITQAYRSAGYPLASAYVPAQTLSGGTVRLAVLEARYGQVHLDNRSRTSSRVLEATLAPLAPGTPVAESSLDRSLLLLGDIPGVAVDSVLRPGSTPGSSDLFVEATDRPRYSGMLAVDDYGNRYTGRIRVSGVFDINSLLHQGDLLGAQVLTSGPDMKYGRLDYKYLLNGQGTVLGAATSALNYRLGGDLRGLHAHGTAQVNSLYVSHPFIRSVRGNLYGQLGFDRRRLSDDIDLVDAHTRRHSNAWTATLAGDRRDAHSITNFKLAATYGQLGFDDAFAEFVDAVSVRTRGHYLKWTMSLSRLQQLSPRNAIYLGIEGQWANRNLDSAEQFYLGGANNIRGFDTGAASGAQGQMVNLEFRHALSPSLPGNWTATAFADGGRVTIYKDRFAPGPNTMHMQDVGLGLRWTGEHQWAVSADVSHPIGVRPRLAGPGSDRSLRAWVQLQKGF
jgi:hemolysin activation/secretion protein